MLGYSLEWPAGVPVSRALPNTCPPTLTPAAAPIDTRRPRYSSKESTTGWHCLAVRLKALLVFSGGVPAGSTINEAEAMLRYAQRCHARQLASLRQRPVLEPASTSTRENAEFVLSQLRRESPRIRELYVVTNRFHQARACATFRRVASVSSSRVAVRCAHTPPSNRGAPRHAIACPARDPEPLELSLVLVREMAATLTYWAIGWV